MRALQAAPLAGLAFAGQVHAQQAEPPQSTATDLEEVVVTATGTNISGVAPVGSETVVITRDDLLTSGKNNVAEVIRTLPQVQNLGFDEAARGNNAMDTGNATRGTSINLRGVGQVATLVLVDGHRLTPAGATSAFTEAVQVPFAAVERIEIIPDGASAVYGSDAISGVVNYVLRKDFDGVELTGRYSSNHYHDSWMGSLLGGTHWEGFGPLGRGNVILSYEHSRQSPVVRGDLATYRQDLRPLGGIDNRLINNSATPDNPGNIVVSTTPLGCCFIPVPPGPNNSVIPGAGTNTYYGLPPGTNGVGLTLADLRVNQPNLVDRADYEDYLPLTERDHVTLLLNQDLNSWLGFYYEGFYSKRDTTTRTFYSNNAGGNLTVNLPVTSPFYIRGIPNTLAPGPFQPAPGPQPLVVQYNMLAHLPEGYRFANETPEETYSHTAGFRAQLPGEWSADFYYTYGTVDNCGVCFLGIFVNPSPGNALQRAVDEGFINPLSSARLTQEQFDRIRGDNIQQSQNRLHDTVLKFDGPLFTLPGGRVRGAVGFEYGYQVNRLQNGAHRPPLSGVPPGTTDAFVWDAQVDKSRYQNAAFAELYVPLVGAHNTVPVVRSLALSAAFRYDSYSDFGNTTNPKLGVTWELNDEFSLRGSWGTSFRAPGLPELNNGLYSTAFVFLVSNNSGDPSIPISFNNLTWIVGRIGGNPTLDAEEGATWTAGFDFAPRFAEGLSVSGTYYSITYDNKIMGPNLGQFLSNPANRAAYASLITPVAPVAGCVENNPATWPAAIRDFLENPNIEGLSPLPGLNGRSFLYNIEGIIGNVCQARALLDGRNTNASKTFQDGVDLRVGYSFNAAKSFWNTSVSVSRILHNNETIIAGTPENNALDRVFFPVSLRGRANIAWARGSWNATLAGNYVGKYRNDAPITVNNVLQPQSDVPSWGTVDINVGYGIPASSGVWGLEGVRLSVTAQNVFDRDPPVVLVGSTANDARNHNPLGRQWQFSFTKQF